MKTFTLDQFGGKADGQFDNSEAFKKALTELKEAGSGKLIVGKGKWSTGPIELFSGTELHLEEGCEVSFIPEPERYPPVFTRWEGVECWCMHPCVFSKDQNNVKVTGKGVFDGNGSVWWKMRESKRGQDKPVTEIEKKFAAMNPGFEDQPGGGGGREVQFLRPPLVQFLSCTDILLEDVTLRNSPFWTMHPVYVKGLVLKGITVQNPHNAPNTDGIDIDSCEDVQVLGCTVSVGDDGIALKSGSGPDGIKINRPCRNVLVRDCVVGDGHGGIVIGSETAAGVDHLVAENCTFNGTDRGIRIKTRRGRGGDIHNLVFRNLTMIDNLCPFAVNMYYKCGAKPEDEFFTLDKLPINDATPHIHDITISGIKATGCKASAGFIVGLPERPIKNLTIKDSTFETNESSNESPQESEMFYGLPPVEEKSFRIKFADNPKFENVTVKGPAEPFIYE